MENFRCGGRNWIFVYYAENCESWNQRERIMVVKSVNVFLSIISGLVYTSWFSGSFNEL